MLVAGSGAAPLRQSVGRQAGEQAPHAAHSDELSWSGITPSQLCTNVQQLPTLTSSSRKEEAAKARSTGDTCLPCSPNSIRAVRVSA